MKISQQVADAQFEMFSEYYDFDESDSGNEDVRHAMAGAKARVVKAIRRGRVEIEETEGDIVVHQHLKFPLGEVKSLRYGVITGKAKVAMEKGTSGDENYAKIYALLGSLSGLGSTAISALRGVDLSTAECIGAIFLQV